MAYRYIANNSPRDRFTQLALLLDNGSTAIIEQGKSYELSSPEVARATRFVVMQFTSSTADAAPIGITYLPIKGTPQNGQVPVWSEADASFVPGTVAGGGSGSTWAEDPVLGWQTRPVTSQPVIWVQTVGTADPTSLMSEYDIYVGDPPA